MSWKAMLIAALTSQATAPPQSPPVAATACATLAQCMAEIRDPARPIMRLDSDMDERIAAFGDAAVDALVPLLTDPDAEMRARAGYLLASFRRIDPRHLPDLAQAWRQPASRGNGWLPRAIAATGTDEALALLWQDFLRDPDQGSNAQVHFALARFGAERLRPLIVAGLASCDRAEDRESCHGLFSLLRTLQPPFPEWSLGPLVTLAASAESDEVRASAEEVLVHLRHPAGLAAFLRRLETLAEAPQQRGSDHWEVRRLVLGIERYGAAAREAGSLIARYLAPDHHEDLRAAAALALGRIDDRSAVPALLAIEHELGDDWLLAYNVSESLGRLRAAEARPLLERLMRSHWHPGVRNNAARALGAIDTGQFARPDVPGDGAPYPPPRDEEGNEYLYFGGLRFAGDDATRWCATTAEPVVRLSQDPAGAIRWPRRGAARIELGQVQTGLEAIDDVTRRQLREQGVRGSITFRLPIASGELVGFNGGEFGGGVVHFPDRGAPRPLLNEPVAAAWRMGGRVYVAAGLAHLVLDDGHLYVIDPVRTRVERIVRLPASPRALALSSDRAVVVRTGEGDVAVREDGRLTDPQLLDECTGSDG